MFALRTGKIVQSGKSQKTISSSNRTVYVLTKFKFFVQYRQKYLTYESESITISEYGNSDEFAVFRAYCMNFMCLYCSLHIICTRPVRFCEGQLYFLSFRKSSFDCGVFGRFFPFIMNEWTFPARAKSFRRHSVIGRIVFSDRKWTQLHKVVWVP